jgi:hypothetical protein
LSQAEPADPTADDHDARSRTSSHGISITRSITYIK